MNIEKKLFGTTKDQKEVYLYTLVNDNDMTVRITNFGGIITSVLVPDKMGESGDVVLGFDNLEDYMGVHPYFGALVGRYANRISGGSFRLNNEKYSLLINNGPNHLHGGGKGFDKKIWTATPQKKLAEISLHLAIESPDGEEGYPGNLLVEVIYTLTNNNELIIDYVAGTDKDTIINLTNHSYFNLNLPEGDVKNHSLMLDADFYTPVDDTSIPTGEILSVKGTAFDFTKEKFISQDFDELEMGYDHNYIINKPEGDFHWFAKVYEAKSGRLMEVGTTEPGVQLYTANYVNNIKGKKGMTYNQQSALCLETQHFPDSPNKGHFPSVKLIPGKKYTQKTIYKFSVK